MNAARNAFARVLDALWPRRCESGGCGRRVDRPGRLICSACFDALPFATGPACMKCGRIFPGADTCEFTCEACAKARGRIDRARHAAGYEGPVPALVKTFKYGNGWWLAQDLADMVEGAVRSRLPWHDIDAVVPVPLHTLRQRARGYNQSWLIASGLAERLGRAALEHGLVRTRDTGHQARLPREGRMRNVEGAFAAPRPELVRGRTLLLVDDVSTTGATLEECARALKDAGAVQVWAATVCSRSQDDAA